MDYSGATSALKVQVFENYEAMSREAASRILSAVRKQPKFLLCASAGSTPTRTYQVFAAHKARHPRLFSRLRVLQIDEWAGLPRGNPASCAADLQERLAAPLQLSHERFMAFRSNAPKPRRECERIGRWLADHGPIDLCILGLGGNGHVAMNEPADALVPHVHVVRLSGSSRNHAMLRGLARKPRHGLTLGIGDILRSRRILLLVSGRKKRAVLKRLFRPGVTARFPASFLWLHPDVTVLCDREAAGNHQPRA
jgi:galactosamine-6-phosphate isomerase